MTGILLAPFSNSGIRDWPGGHYRALIGLLLDRLPPDASIRLVGIASHRWRAAEIVRPHPATRVINLCGRVPWAEVVRLVRTTDCLVANNSGMAHLGGLMGVPTVSIFAGTHQRREWRALGASVTLITRAIGCSPCQLDHGQVSPYDKACLREIAPEVVADVILRTVGTGRHATMQGEQAA